MLRHNRYFSLGVGEKRLLWDSASERVPGVSETASESKTPEVVRMLFKSKEIQLEGNVDEVLGDTNPLLKHLVLPAHLLKAKGFRHSAGKIELAHKVIDGMEGQSLRDIERRLRLAVASAPNDDARKTAQRLLDKFLKEAGEEHGTGVDEEGVRHVKAPANSVIDSGVKENIYEIKELAYAALVWPKVKKGLNDLLSDGVSDEQLKKALADLETRPKLKELVLDLAKKEASQLRFDDEFMSAVRVEISGDRHKEEVNKRTHKELKVLREENLSKYEVRYDSEGALATPDKLAEYNMNFWKLSIDRSNNRVNANNWNIGDKSGMARLHFDLKHGLNLDTKDEPLKGVLNQLAKASDENYLKSVEGVVNKQCFMQPERHEAELKEVSGGEDFLRAYKYYKALKSSLVLADQREAAMDKSVNEMDRIPGVDAVIDGVKKNAAEFAKAVREKDWATAGIYVGGLYAAYKLLQGSGDNKFMKHLKTAALWGGVGLLALKGYETTTGTDLLKKVGLARALKDVEKTDLANLFNIPGLSGLEKVDTDILLEASNIPMAQLWAGYNRSHDSSNAEGGGRGAGFINPLSLRSTRFEKKFGGLTGGVSEKRKDTEYERSGTQLYLIIDLAYRAYMQTSYIDPNSPYYGRSFDDVMKGVEGQEGIDKFLAEMLKYTKVEVTDKGETEAKKRLNEVFANKNVNPQVYPVEVAGQKFLAGTVMGYPVAVLNTGHGYEIYDYDVYIGGGPNKEVMLRVPTEGEVSEVDDFVNTLKSKALARITETHPEIDPVWNGQNWEYSKAGDEVLNSFGIEPGVVRVKIIMVPGKPPEHVDAAGGANELIAKKFVESEEFNTLSSLFNSKDLKVINPKVDGTFDVVIGRVKIEIQFADGKFSIISGEEFLASDKNFVDKYLDSLLADRMVGVDVDIVEIEELIKNANSDFVGYVWEKILGNDQAHPQTGLAAAINGSVARNHSSGLLQATKLQVKARVFAANHSTFESLKNGSLENIKFVKNNLAKVKRSLSDKTDEWNSDEYKTQVADKISDAGCVSNNYKLKKIEVNKKLYKATAKWHEGSAFSEDVHARVNKGMEVWFSKTVSLDTANLDDKSDTSKAKVAYLDYVAGEVVRMASSGNNVEIKNYEEWVNTVSIGTLNHLVETPAMNDEEIKKYFTDQFILRYKRLEVKYGADNLKRIDGDTKKRFVIYQIWNSNTPPLGISNKGDNDQSQLDRWTKEIVNAGRPRWEQENMVERFLYEKVDKAVRENMDDRFRNPDVSPARTVNKGARKAADAVSAGAARAKRWLDEKYNEVKDYIFDSWMEVKISKPNGFVPPAGLDFPALMKTVNRLGNTVVFNDNVSVNGLVNLFTQLEAAWREKYDDGLNKFEAFKNSLKERDEELDEETKQKVVATQTYLKRYKDQMTTAKKLQELVSNRNDHEKFYDYAKKHFQ